MRTLLFVLLPALALAAKPAAEADLKTDSAAVVFARAAPSVVLVRADLGQGRTSQGSGVIIRPGVVVTNLHVVQGATKVKVTLKGKELEAKVTQTSKKDRDLALLSVDTKGGTVAPRRASSTLTVGEKVFAIGNPRGYEQTLTDGLISGLRKEGSAFVVQTSAAISPGSSGGGLFDAHGKLIGITTWTRNDSQSLNFANPVEWIDELLKGAGGPEVASAQKYSVSQRPAALNCELSDSARWGIFSEGLELLESSPTSGAILLSGLDGTVPELKTRSTRTGLVLSDMSRQSQMALFRGERSELVLVGFEESGDLRLTLVSFVAERTEPRMVTRSGLCTAATADDAVAKANTRWKEETAVPAASGKPGETCDDEVADACFADAMRTEGGPRFLLLKKACRLGHGGACDEAMVMAQSVDDRANAELMRQWRQNAAQGKKTVAAPAPAPAAPAEPSRKPLR